MAIHPTHRWLSCLLALMVALVPVAGFAQSGLTVEAQVEAVCDSADFSLNVSGGSGTHDIAIMYGDGESDTHEAVSTYPLQTNHTYPGSGDYEWSVVALDSSDGSIGGDTSGVLSLGPTVTLTSDPFPPLLTLDGGSASLDFSAQVDGGQPPYLFSWDLDGDGLEDPGADSSSSSATFSYDSAGNFTATVTVTDDCGLSHQDTLAVVVFDPEDACHPRAQQIAEAVSSLFPLQAGQLYSCEDIFGIFNGDLTGSQLGFGRMWHAYQLAVSLEELTWEEILDWQLEQTGWGRLAQLDRFGEALADVGLRELFDMVISGEASIKEVLSAVRAAARFEADFADALARVQSGANAGELNQFYRLVDELDMDPAALDAYLDTGVGLPELRHGARLADRYDTDLDSVLAARSNGASWGDIQQAQRLATDEITAEMILEQGVQAFRQEARETERRERAIDRYAQQFGVSQAEAEAAYDACDGDNKCIRDLLSGATGQSSQDERTAYQLARQYDVSLAQVWQVYETTCAMDWKCVRDHFRNLTGGGNGNQGQGNNN